MALFVRFFQRENLTCGADERIIFLGVKNFFEAFRSFGGENAMPEQQKMISSGELGKIIGKTARTVQTLAENGTLTCVKEKNKNKYNLYTVIQEYTDYMTKRNLPKGSSLEDEKTYEDIRFKRAKADRMELEFAELEGRMHSAEDVESMTTDLILCVRSSLLSLPGRLGSDVADTDNAAECSEIIKKAVCEILEDLSHYKYNPDEYRKRVRERKGFEAELDEEDG